MDLRELVPGARRDGGFTLASVMRYKLVQWEYA